MLSVFLMLQSVSELMAQLSEKSFELEVINFSTTSFNRVFFFFFFLSKIKKLVFYL